jgi:3-oxoacyl-[acyl-carrier protein] reductase
MKKYVLITGGSRGIGASCVKRFAKEGYNVIFTYLKNRDLAEKLKADIEKDYNLECYTYPCDISKENDIRKLYEYINGITDKIDVLVNNAGISSDKPIADKSIEEFKSIIDVNLVGTYAITKYFYPMIIKGSIINIASNDGIDTCYKDEMDYASSKAGVISLTKTMAKEFAPNIRVNAIAPGWVDTDMSKSDISDDELQYERDLILLHRFAKPEEIANVVYFLSSDEASYINGEVIRVDGGY